MKNFVLASLLAPFALVLVVDANPAKAVLDYSIDESQGSLAVVTTGSLSLPASVGASSCGANGSLFPGSGLICTGLDQVLNAYTLSGPSRFTGTAFIYPASSVSGISTVLHGGYLQFFVDPSYASGTLIISSATFNDTALANLGFQLPAILVPGPLREPATRSM